MASRSFGRPRAVVVGSVNVDFVWHGPRLPAPGETVGDGVFVRTFGGKGANQAAAAARLGAHTGIIGAIGDDELGTAARADLVARGVDCSSLVTIAGCATGVALINVASETGENTVTVAPGANHRMELEAIRIAVEGRVPRGDTRADVLVAGYEIGAARAASALAAARALGISTICNPSPVDRVDTSSQASIAQSDVVIVNDVEAEAYGGAQRLLELGAASVVVTHGRAGATRVDHHGVTHVIGFDVEAADSTGAGDAFCAAYALRRDLDFACAAGALACRAIGARTALPTVAEVEELIRAQPRSTR